MTLRIWHPQGNSRSPAQISPLAASTSQLVPSLHRRPMLPAQDDAVGDAVTRLGRRDGFAVATGADPAPQNDPVADASPPRHTQNHPVGDRRSQRPSQKRRARPRQQTAFRQGAAVPHRQPRHPRESTHLRALTRRSCASREAASLDARSVSRSQDTRCSRSPSHFHARRPTEDALTRHGDLAYGSPYVRTHHF